MGDHRKLAIVVSALLAILLPQSILVSSSEAGSEWEFSYKDDSELGPHHWGKLHREWAACGNGRMQSPIDIVHDRAQIRPQLGPLRRYYRPALAILKNRGHDIMLTWEDEAGALWINGTAYNLKQLHWHSPSEHAINGRRCSLEMHMVHESADKKIAVIGILYSVGDPHAVDPFISQLEEYINKIADVKDGEVAVGTINARNIKLGSWKYYRYEGSLTTPPCTEGVTWTILRKVRTVSKNQVELLKMAVLDDYEMNARPMQKTNSRTISYSGGKNQKEKN